MTLKSIYIGEGYANNPSNFVYVVCWWAEQRHLPGLHAWIKELDSYDTHAQAQILIDWIDKYCGYDEINNCIQVLTEMNNDLKYDDNGYVVGTGDEEDENY